MRFFVSCVGLLASMTALHAEIITVATTIQVAVDAAQPGDTVRVPPGVYRENVRVTKDDITIEGGLGAILDGAELPGTTGIRVASAAPGGWINGFALRGLTFRNYRFAGVFLIRVDNFVISHGRYIDNDQYGVYPVFSSNGRIEHNWASSSNHAGIYVGQSTDVSVTNNHCDDNLLGFIITNCSRIEIRDNKASENTVGIMMQTAPGLRVTESSDFVVTGNVVIDNNRPNVVTDPADPFIRLPSGIGILSLAADRVWIEDNVVTNNDSVGIAVTGLPRDLAGRDPRVDPLPDDNAVLDNIVMQNGRRPDALSPFPGCDLAWDLSGDGNYWHGNVFKKSFPAVLPNNP